MGNLYTKKNEIILPNEMWWQVMLFLPLEHLHKFSLSSKKFYKIQKNDNFWKERFQCRFEHGYPDCLVKNGTWKEKYNLFTSLLNLNMKNLIGFLGGYEKYWKTVDFKFLIEYAKKHKQFVTGMAPSSHQIWNNKFIMSIVIKESPYIIRSVGNLLKNDKEFMLEIIKIYPCFLRYASKYLKNDKEIVLEAVERDGDVLKYASKRLQKNKHVFYTAVKNKISLLKCANSEILNNEKTMLELIELNKDALSYVGEKLKKNKFFMRKAIAIESLNKNQKKNNFEFVGKRTRVYVKKKKSNNNKFNWCIFFIICYMFIIFFIEVWVL